MPMPLTVRSRQMTELLPAVHAGVRAGHLRSHYADDAVQQALMALLPHLERLSAMTERERNAYVFVTASRTAMGIRKRLGADHTLGSDTEVAEWAERHGVPFQRQVSPEEALHAAERVARADRALGAMATGERDVVRAVADGRSEREAAEHLGISRGGVAYRLRRAREALGAAWNGTTSWARRRPPA